MKKSEFTYKRRPAFISFLLTYVVFLGIAYLLMQSSPAISEAIKRQVIAQMGIPRSNVLWILPYGTLLSLPFFVYSIRTILWNSMSIYEINPSEIRLLTGSVIRKERFFLISDFYSISFKQNLIEIPFGVGSVALKARGKGRLVIKGVYDVKTVIEALRPGLGIPL
jgi:uncharacterized membrane protein YdbT with pleckstrin-like domain